MIVDEENIPVGYVHLKDVLRVTQDGDPDGEREIPAKRVHDLVPVHTTTDLEDALALMRRASKHLARVRNDEGETVAVLFLEDIIEELVGEVQDATERSRRAS